MQPYAVISDSACDLPSSVTKQQKIDIVPFKISFDKVNKLTEGIGTSNDTLYRMLETAKTVPKTYFPTVGDYVTAFKKRLEQGQDIVCLCLSSKLSKSYHSAMNAKKILDHSYPNNKIRVIDTLLASAGQAILVLDAVKLRESAGADEAFNRLEAAKKDSGTILTVATLDQLAKGGRMSNTTAAFGKLLSINPIIYLEKGALVSKEKAIGRKKALEKIKQLVVREINNQPEFYDFALLHSRALGDAKAVGDALKLNNGITQTLPPIELGATIGMHTGTSVVAVAYVKKV